MKKNSKKKAEAKQKHFNRIESVVQVFQQSGPISKDTWIKKADQLYVRHGGPSNIKESSWGVRHVLATLRAMELTTEKDGQIQLKK